MRGIHAMLNQVRIELVWSLGTNFTGLAMLGFETRSIYFDWKGGGAKGRFDWGTQDILHAQILTGPWLKTKLKIQGQNVKSNTVIFNVCGALETLQSIQMFSVHSMTYRHYSTYLLPSCTSCLPHWLYMFRIELDWQVTSHPPPTRHSTTK